MRRLSDKILPDQTGNSGKILSTDGEEISWIAGAAGGLTQEEVDDRVAALLIAGTNITLTYNDGAGTLTIDASGGSGSTSRSRDFLLMGG